MPVATTVAPAKSRLKIIDADTHFTEPHDLWTRRAPASIRDRVPQVKLIDGQQVWMIEGDIPISYKAHPGSVVLKNGDKLRSMVKIANVTFDEVHAGSYDVKARLAVMNENGVYAQIVYPNTLGFGGQKAAKADPALRLVTVQLFNDAMAEVQSDSGQRMFPMAMIPWWDRGEAVAEIERAAKLGLRGVNINSDPHTQTDKNGDPIPDLASTYWDPMWEACQSLDMSVNFHIGSSDTSMMWAENTGWPSLQADVNAGLGGAMLFFNNARIVGNIIYSGLLDRYPKLKFVSVESGIGWIPFLLQALDYQLDEIAEEYKFDLRPSEYFKRNFLGCFWFEKDGLAEDVRRVGIDNCMFETDFPHPTSLYPIENLDERLSGFSAEESAKVLGLNAARTYRIPLE